METPADSSRPPGPCDELGWIGPRLADAAGRSWGAAAGSRASVLGSLTIPGRPEQVGLARAFVVRTLSLNQVGADTDAATLLTSEIVTNAIQHTKSGVEGGTVTIVVIGVPRGVLVEIIDDGSAGTPIVKGDLYAAEGHGLFLVQHLAAQWGYLRDSAGTTVWFHLPAACEPQSAARQPGPVAGHDVELPAAPDGYALGGHAHDGYAPGAYAHDGYAPGAYAHDGYAADAEPYRTRPTQLWAAVAPPAATPA
jgi:anti-sigma regulatory factor (Ser/Thr protein kinase)